MSGRARHTKLDARVIIELLDPYAVTPSAVIASGLDGFINCNLLTGSVRPDRPIPGLPKGEWRRAFTALVKQRQSLKDDVQSAREEAAKHPLGSATGGLMAEVAPRLEALDVAIARVAELEGVVGLRGPEAKRRKAGRDPRRALAHTAAALIRLTVKLASDEIGANPPELPDFTRHGSALTMLRRVLEARERQTGEGYSYPEGWLRGVLPRPRMRK
jgi:thioesterase domain-containing protein